MNPDAFRASNEEIEVERSPLPGPVLTYVGGRNWRLESDYAYDHRGTLITVPAGFIFDLSSVPRALWWLIAPFELSVTAPLLHDFLYREAGDPGPGSIRPPRVYSRREADLLFREVMEQEGVATWRRDLGYAAVRLFAHWAWRRDLEETGRDAGP